ncbi:MAG TPA: hypothetical protein PKM36_01210 [Propionibacteriaceae bacterium]|nr:hypothetical protein [Propionibacteriaceae bacterium]HPZ50237.1 hypothetical protein [Propionibacteriaceae bacterium]HQE31109.1 hypothetical protein [Propionibacteriaceae bacterium]
MSLDFIAYAGRPWPIDQVSDALRQVGYFDSLTEACLAFGSIEFVQLPTLAGRMRWRGWSPQQGLIVQIERPLFSDGLLRVAS